MNKGDKPRFVTILEAMALNFGGKLSPPLIDLWFKMFQDWSIEQFDEAAKNVIATRVYRNMPTVAEFKQALVGNVEDVAQVEAGKVLNAIATVGVYNSVVFDDPFTVAVISQGYGGWIKLCSEMTEDKKGVFLGQFRKMYVAYRNRGVRAEIPKLPGLLERDNCANGLLEYVPEHVFVGDPVKCRRLLSLAEKDKPKEIGMKQNVKQLTGMVGKGI